MPYKDYVSQDTIEPVIWNALMALSIQVKHLVPVDSGALRNSMSWSTNRRKASEDASAFMGGGPGEIEQPNEDFTGVIGSVMEYAAAVEYGKPEVPNYPAQPYLRPAAAWLKSKIGMMSAKELKVQLAYYNIKHPYKTVEIRNEGKNVVSRTGKGKAK